MKVIKRDLKAGIIKVKVESLDDLWHLDKILEPGDIVRARTTRKTTIKRGRELVEGKRKQVTLVLEAEKTGFRKNTGRLRITGPIREAPEEVETGSYHTIEVKPGLVLTIKKDWKKKHLERLERARVKEPELFIVMIDRDQANFAELTASGVNFLGTKNYSKTADVEEKRKAFYQEILENLLKKEKYQAIILAGPGFEPENFLKFVKEKKPKLSGKIFLEKASTTGKSGVQEVIRKSANKTLHLTRVAKETQMVEEFLARVGKDGLAVYGPGETGKALEYGAVDTLLVSETKLSEFEGLMDLAEKQNSKVMVISNTHEAGERFLNMGGIGGLLRFGIQ